MRGIFTIMITLLVGCSAADKPSICCELPVATTTIKHLAERASERVSRIEEGVVVYGRVTSSDEEGGFYRRLMVENDGAALEVMVGIYTLHALYPEGLEVALSLGGCAMQLRDGVVQVGAVAPSYTSYGVDYLDTREAVDRVIMRGRSVEPLVPYCVSAAELEDGLCGRLIEVDSLRVVAATSLEEYGDARWLGDVLLCGTAGDSVVVSTSKYVRYSEMALPDDVVAIRGILRRGTTTYGKCFQLEMRYYGDAR